MIKHVLLLIPRLIREWWVDIYLLRNRVAKNEGLLRVADGIERAYYTRHGISTLPLQAVDIYFNQKYTDNMSYNGASILLNRGEPVKLLHCHIEDSNHTLAAKDSMDIAGASLIALKPFTDPYSMYPEEVSISLENLESNVYNLSTSAAVVLMSFYACCGKGFVWPQKHYKKLLRIYMINLLLKPIQGDYRAVMALYALSVRTNNPLWKLLYKLNSRHTPIEKIESYA
jgi:hypothetical protein